MSSIHVHSHYSRFASFLESGVYDSANAHLLTLLLETDIKQDELKEVCKKVDQLLPQLTENESIILLHHLLTALQNYPLLLDERALILTRYGELFLQKELQFDHLVTVMHSFTTAQFPGESLFTPLLPFIYREFRIRLGKADPVSFGELLQTFYDRFGLNSEITKKLHEIAFEVYMERVKSTNASQFSPYLFTITDGKEGRLPISNSPIPTTIYRERLREIRTANYTQYERASAFCDFFRMLIEDAIFILGEPPSACHYDIRASGSLARAEMCPYSDLEYFILINEERFRPYFEKLAQILHLQVLSLGETPPDKQEIFQFGQKSGLRIDPSSNPALDSKLINTVDKLFVSISVMDHNRLKAFKSHLDTISLYRNHAFALPHLASKEQALLLLEMRRKEFQELKILQGAVCHLKYELIEPLFHFLGDLGLYFGLGGGNTIDLIDELPLFTLTSKRLLQRAVRELYELRVRLHLNSEEIQDQVLLQDVDLPLLKMIHQLVLIPLYTIDLETPDIDLITIALKDPNEENVALAAQFVEESHPHYYTMLSSPDHVALQRIYLDQVLGHKEVLAEIPNRAGYRLSRELEEEQLQQSLRNITTDDPASGIKISSPLIGERYLTAEAAEDLLDPTGHIKRTYTDALHRVSFFQDLHFKEMPYQPLMEYAIHSLTHRIMGKASPATTLARLDLSEDLSYPILISETIEGEKLGIKTELDQEHLTWLRLCEMLTKPGDGRLSNYVVREGKVFCIDNDLSFMPVVQKQRFFKDKVSFCSMLFMLNVPLHPDVLRQFCALEPDLILPDWLEEMQRQEALYLDLFPNLSERKRWYESKIESFTPTLPFTEGTIVTLSTQFHLLQSALREKTYEHPLELLQKLIHFQRSGSSPEDPLVEEQYKKALQLPFNRRLSGATERPDQSLTSAQAMELQFSERPTFEQIQPGGKYSLKQAYAELCLLEAHKLWARHIEGDSISVDFSAIRDPEREKLMLKSLAFLLESKTQKPTSISLRHTQTLTPDMLNPLLHPALRSLDLSYGALVSEGGLFTASTLSPVETLSPSLEELHLDGCPSLVQPTITLSQLRRLNISRCPNLNSLSLQKAQLQELKIIHSPRLKTVMVSITPETEVDWKETPGPAISHMAEQWYQLGKHFAEGDGVPRDPEKALTLWEKAAAGGHKHAQEILKWNKRFNENPTSLYLGNNQIGKQGASAIAEALKVNHTLSSLDLEDNQIGEQGAAALAHALKVNQTLSSLNLWGNEIGEQGAAALAHALKVNQTLSSLELSSNQIGEQGAAALADALKVNQTLTSLKLGNNQIREQGAAALAQALKDNQTLSYLYLRNNQIGEQGAAALAHALKVNQTLSSLYLWKNQIGEQGAAAFANALKVNQTLSSLYLQRNRIGNQGATALADALKVNQTLSSFDLWNNQIGEQGATALADALKVNQTLSSLDLWNNQIGEHNSQACEELVSRNKSLQDSALKAAQKGDTQLFHFLDRGVSLYSQEEEKNTFLHLAAAHGHADLIQPLLDRSRNPTFPSWKNKEGKTALDLARENDHTAIVELLSSQE